MALEEVPILNEVAAEAPARPAKRTKRDTGLNGGYWGSLPAPDSGEAGDGAQNEGKIEADDPKSCAVQEGLGQHDQKLAPQELPQHLIGLGYHP